jgi:hypothetical protein
MLLIESSYNENKIKLILNTGMTISFPIPYIGFIAPIYFGILLIRKFSYKGKDLVFVISLFAILEIDIVLNALEKMHFIITDEVDWIKMLVLLFPEALSIILITYCSRMQRKYRKT